MQFRLGPSLRVAAAALVLGSWVPAHAAVYTGQWDPAYGPSLPNLGFQGSAEFFVPDACLTGPAQLAPLQVPDVTSPCSLGAMSLLNAKVEFYDLANPLVILETLVFAPPALLPDPVFAAYIQYDAGTLRNEVVGVETVLFGPETSALPQAGLLSFQLAFSWDAGLGQSVARLYASNNSVSAPAVIDFSLNPGNQVPEPGSLALVAAAALGAGWAVRRRRRG